MDALAALALRFPEVPLVLAHAAIADQGMFASRLADHPAVVYDTSCFAALDVVELFARVPAERIVFASDIPYGRPVPALHLALRVAAYAGLDEQRARARRRRHDDRAASSGGRSSPRPRRACARSARSAAACCASAATSRPRSARSSAPGRRAT